MSELSWFDRLKEAIVPQSEGERLVEEMLSTPPAVAWKPPADANFSTPAFVASAGRSITNVVEGATSKVTMTIVIVAAFALVALFVYGAAPFLVKRFFR